MTRRAWLALIASLATASCAAPLMKLPSGPGAPATDAIEALSQAVSVCRAIKTMSAEVSVAGRVGGRRTRARLMAGLAAPASAYLDAPAPFGASAFIYAARGDEATLLLPRDRRVLEHGRPADILEAVTGVPVDAEQLRATLSGCTSDADANGARAFGPSWRVIPGRDELYLRRDSPTGRWRLVMVVHRRAGRPAWRAEYGEFSDNLPRAIRLTSLEGGFDLQLTVSQVEINVAIAPDAFQPGVPPGYVPITIDQLRQAGPLSEGGGAPK